MFPIVQKVLFSLLMVNTQWDHVSLMFQRAVIRSSKSLVGDESLWLWVSLSLWAVVGAPENLVTSALRNRGLAAAQGSCSRDCWKAESQEPNPEEKNLYKIMWLFFFFLHKGSYRENSDSHLVPWDCNLQAYFFFQPCVPSYCLSAKHDKCLLYKWEYNPFPCP